MSQDEIHWLILCGEHSATGIQAGRGLRRILAAAARPVDRGVHPRASRWSDRCGKLARVDDGNESDRLRLTTGRSWRGATLSRAYVDFWNRTGRRLEIADPSGRATSWSRPTTTCTGARLVSVTARSREHDGVLPKCCAACGSQLRSCRSETEYPDLAGDRRLGPRDVLRCRGDRRRGRRAWIRLPRDAWSSDAGDRGDEPMSVPLRAYIARHSGRRGFLPMRLTLRRSSATSGGSPSKNVDADPTRPGPARCRSCTKRMASQRLASRSYPGDPGAILPRTPCSATRRRRRWPRVSTRSSTGLRKRVR